MRRPTTAPCDECGLPQTKIRHWGRPFLHVECATKRAAEVAIQMQRRRGPAWEKYRVAQPEGVKRYRASLGR